MKSTKIFLTFFILNSTFYIGTANAQFWVDGGNLIWPYGDVTIQNDLNLGKSLTLNDTIYFNDDSTKIYNHRFYEEGEFSENGIKFDLKTSTNNHIYTFGQSGLSYAMDGIGYLSASNNGLTARSGNGSFSLTSISNNQGAIRFSRTSDSYFADIVIGAGTPEGSVSARVGSIYLRTDGGAGSTFYVKETGVGNTGWVAK